MNEFIVKMTNTNNNLDIISSEKTIGCQYDNHASMLIFERPNEFASDNLILKFFDGVIHHEPINLGKKNTFIITSSLTQRASPKFQLSLQVIFERDGTVIEHSNIIKFNIRPSILKIHDIVNPEDEDDDGCDKNQSNIYLIS